VTEQERSQLYNRASQCFRHYEGCRLKDPDNCSGCALRTGGEEGPNYAGWARVYIEAGVRIPRKWKAAFLRELRSPNLAYAEALLESIGEFGMAWQTERQDAKTNFVSTLQSFDQIKG
jgi:hypothetical protein